MRVGRIRKGSSTLSVILHKEQAHSLTSILGLSERSISEDFYSIITSNIKMLQDSVEAGEGVVDPDWSYEIPVPRINQIRDFYAFEEHVKAGRKSRGLEMIPEWYEIPVFYYSGNSSLYASGKPVPYPGYTEQLDFELEIGVIIGKQGKNIRRKDAMDHIFGALFVNDWSARDIQKREMKLNLGPAKSKDFATSMGPYVVTMDELLKYSPDGERFDVDVYGNVNGTRYSRANLGTIYWTFSQMIERASQEVTLHEGDLIMSGTVGTGCILELGPDKHGWLRKGDVVEFSSPVLGSLVNKIV